jgi:hypothetical protein
MNTLEFENRELAVIGNFLGEVTLKSKASRGRSKLIKLLTVKNEEYSEERQDLLDPYVLKDKDGKRIEGDRPGTVKLVEDMDKRDECAQLMQELETEHAVISITEFSEKLQALYDALKDYDQELNNQDAVIYDLLMDQLEANFEGDNTDEN